jgi:linoleoyl-CoA desaturase
MHPMSETTKVTFPRNGAFYTELKRRVAAHFEANDLEARDQPGMYLKTGIIVAWLVGSYLALFFLATTWWMVVPLAISAGLATAAVGFNIQHDGGHGAYSRRNWVNRTMALTMDAIGASSYVWHWKHNIVHHTYVNIADVDSDIDLGWFGRLSPHQPWRRAYRFQHIYLWLLYAFLTLKWVLVDDFRDLATGRVGTQKLPRPSAPRLVQILGMKAFFFCFALVLPLFFRPVGGVLLAFFVAMLTTGFVTSLVFQLAHVVDVADFPSRIRPAAPWTATGRSTRWRPRWTSPAGTSC